MLRTDLSILQRMVMILLWNGMKERVGGRHLCGKAMVSGGNIVLPCSEYDEPELAPVGLCLNLP